MFYYPLLFITFVRREWFPQDECSLDDLGKSYQSVKKTGKSGNMKKCCAVQGKCVGGNILVLNLELAINFI